MRSSSNSDPASYWQAITVASSTTSTAAGEYVATLNVPRSRVEGGGGAASTTSTVNLPIRGVYCSVGGNATLQFTKEDGNTATVVFKNLQEGVVYPFCPSRVTAVTGGAELVALYG